jgi:hypothetical protein
MKRLGSHRDNCTFEEAKERKNDSKAARRECKVLAKAEKRSERQKAIAQALYE